MRFDLALCRAFMRGYLVDAREFLTSNDRRYLCAAIRLLPLELGLRFFQDYLAGNVYFKMSAPDHNLHRARVQFELCARVKSLARDIDVLLNAELLDAERLAGCRGGSRSRLSAPQPPL